MPKAKNYTLILNSANATNRTGTLNNGYTFYVNWSSIMPYIEDVEYHKYILKWTFYDVPQVAATGNLQISVNFGHSLVNDQSGSTSSIIGIVHPVLVSGNYYLTANINDNADIIISRPTNNFITVNFYELSGASHNKTQDYVLALTFEQIEY